MTSPPGRVKVVSRTDASFRRPSGTPRRRGDCSRLLDRWYSNDGRPESNRGPYPFAVLVRSAFPFLTELRPGEKPEEISEISFGRSTLEPKHRVIVEWLLPATRDAFVSHFSVVVEVVVQFILPLVGVVTIRETTCVAIPRSGTPLEKRTKTKTRDTKIALFRSSRDSESATKGTPPTTSTWYGTTVLDRVSFVGTYVLPQETYGSLRGVARIDIPVQAFC
jgi:hypothetical protein